MLLSEFLKSHGVALPAGSSSSPSKRPLEGLPVGTALTPAIKKAHTGEEEDSPEIVTRSGEASSCQWVLEAGAEGNPTPSKAPSSGRTRILQKSPPVVAAAEADGVGEPDLEPQDSVSQNGDEPGDDAHGNRC